MDYTGTIIGESLLDLSVLSRLKILSEKVELITPRHQTPWVKQWTLYKVEVPENFIDEIANSISADLDYTHKGAWFVHFRNNQWDYIIFKDKIFKIDAQNHQEQYIEAKRYGLNLGIPEYQMINFK